MMKQIFLVGIVAVLTVGGIIAMPISTVADSPPFTTKGGGSAEELHDIGGGRGAKAL